jgi:DNA-binding NarL/FixJ family response regulator
LLGALRDLDTVLEPGVLTFEVPSDLPPLRAAVEVAAYRIASEAVHNVTRHARAFLAVAHGDAIFSPTIAARLVRFFAARPTAAGIAFPELTESERSVLRLMARGANNQAIADGLGLSPKTVRNYVSNVFGKLQVADRAQAIVRAHEAGLE